MSTETVPNFFPKVDPTGPRLAVIGEAPGADEVTAGEPFSGNSGRLLRAILAGCGASTAQTFFGNVCQIRPPDNDIDAFDFNGPEIQGGLTQLRTDLQVFRPNCILAVGRTAFRVLRPDLCYPGKKGHHVPLSDWRGSVFTTNHLGELYKATATYHPAYILRSYNDIPFFKFDVARAVRHAASPDFNPLRRTGNLRPTLGQVLDFCLAARRNRTPITLDIEGYPDNVGVTMLSLVPTGDPTTGIVIPFWLAGNYWGEDEEWRVWEALAGLLADENVPKTAHGSFYEIIVLAWRHRMVINNLADDTMMAHWELYPDFAKGDKEEKQKVTATQKKRSLGVCCSLYTDQHFYKDDRLSDDPDVKLNYNFLDSSVTAETRNKTTAMLAKVPASYEHYRFNISIIPPYTYMMLRGFLFDKAKAQELVEKETAELAVINHEINTTLVNRNVFHLFPRKKGKKFVNDPFNVKSAKQKCWLIYDHLGCKELKRWGRTSDEGALLHYYQKTGDDLLRLVIRAVRKRTRLSDIGKLVPDADGRIRTNYDIVGTNSGRGSSRSSTTMIFDPEEGWINSGTNLQNQTEELRICYRADSPDLAIGQWDLAGADAWTVAAELAALGFPTMLEDLLYGLKPSLILYHMIKTHAEKGDVSAINRLPREELKRITKSIKSWLDSVKGTVDPITGRPLDWLYLCCKRVQHGGNYGMQENRTAELIFEDSDGTINISPQDAKFYQSLYKLRYRTDSRNDWIRKTLQKTQCIVTSCGIRRQFFGIRNGGLVDDDIVREASAVNPQANTTFITNTALRNLWYDPRNRTRLNGLFIEPLVQVHDALVIQFRKSDQQWVKERMTEWFHVPIKVQGVEVKIPVEGKWGDTWGACTQPY